MSGSVIMVMEDAMNVLGGTDLERSLRRFDGIVVAENEGETVFGWCTVSWRQDLDVQLPFAKSSALIRVMPGGSFDLAFWSS